MSEREVDIELTVREHLVSLNEMRNIKHPDQVIAMMVIAYISSTKVNYPHVPEGVLILIVKNNIDLAYGV